jgi:hypothetical protein
MGYRGQALVFMMFKYDQYVASFHINVSVEDIQRKLGYTDLVGANYDHS